MARQPNPPVVPPAPRFQTSADIEKGKRASVESMVSTKTSLKAMADMLQISIGELKRKYSNELKYGLDHVYAQVSLRLVGEAKRGDMRAMLAWMRHCGGWQEVTRREITGKDGAPISFRNLDAGALNQVVEALRAQSVAQRSRGGGRPQIEASVRDIVDLDTFSGSSDEGADE